MQYECWTAWLAVYSRPLRRLPLHRHWPRETLTSFYTLGCFAGGTVLVFRVLPPPCSAVRDHFAIELALRACRLQFYVAVGNDTVKARGSGYSLGTVGRQTLLMTNRCYRRWLWCRFSFSTSPTSWRSLQLYCSVLNHSRQRKLTRVKLLTIQTHNRSLTPTPFIWCP